MPLQCGRAHSQPVADFRHGQQISLTTCQEVHQLPAPAGFFNAAGSLAAGVIQLLNETAGQSEREAFTHQAGCGVIGGVQEYLASHQAQWLRQAPVAGGQVSAQKLPDGGRGHLLAFQPLVRKGQGEGLPYIRPGGLVGTEFSFIQRNGTGLCIGKRGPLAKSRAQFKCVLAVVHSGIAGKHDRDLEGRLQFGFEAEWLHDCPAYSMQA